MLTLATRLASTTNKTSYGKGESFLKVMKKILKWCGFHEVPMSRCNRTSSWSCYPLNLDKKRSDELKEKRNKQGYNIRNKEL